MRWSGLLQFCELAPPAGQTKRANMALTRTQWVGVLLGVVVVVLVLLGVTGRGHAPEVQLAKVVRQNLDSSITSNGKVEPIQPYIVRAQFPTFVATISAGEGQSVRRGQPILTLDAQDARAQLAQARESLIAAQEDLRAARAGGPAVQMAELEGSLKKAQADVASLQSTQGDVDCSADQRGIVGFVGGALRGLRTLIGKRPR